MMNLTPAAVAAESADGVTRRAAWSPPAARNGLMPAAPKRLADLPPAVVVEQQLEAVQQEMHALREEISLLRRRDQSVNFHMQRIDEELRMAARLQQDFLPRSLPKLGPATFHAIWRPAGYVSGDMYDIVRLDENHVGFYIADAVGHGVPAALLTMFIKHSLVTKEIRDQNYRLLDPGESLGRLNDSLLEQHLATGTFCTACYGVLDLQTLKLELACAGHPAPILLRGDNTPIELRTEGSLLGIFDDERFITTSHQLQTGDRLVLYTDGVEQAFSLHGQKPGIAGFHEVLFKRRIMGGEALIHSLVNHLDNESGSLNPQDDLTVLIAEITQSG